MMTKRLPHINHHRPYKYQELRRKAKLNSDATNAKGEEEYRSLLRSRERTTLATARSNTNLAASRENIATSRDSLVIPEEPAESVKPRTEQQQQHEPRSVVPRHLNELKPDLVSRQTSLDQLNKRNVEGKHVYSFALSKLDRSKSDPVLFPPLNERIKAANVAAARAKEALTSDIRKSTEHLPPPKPGPAANVSQLAKSVRQEKENKPINTIKFPIVSRYDLYKHLGISQTRRKRAGRDSSEERDAKHATVPQAHIQQTPGKSRTYLHLSHQQNQQQQSPRILAEVSGRSRNVSSLHNSKSDQKKMEMYKLWHEEHAINTAAAAPAQRKSRDYDTKEAARLAALYKERYQSDDLRARIAPPAAAESRAPTRTRRDASLPKIGVVKERPNAGRLIESALEGSIVNDRAPPARRDSQSRATNPRAESPPAPIPDELLQRQYSARTWRSWRHHDDSYAYDDVDRYIEENELMDDEKMYHIRQWIVAVDQARLQPDADSDDDCDDDDDVTDSMTHKGSSTDHMSVTESVLTKYPASQG